MTALVLAAVASLAFSVLLAYAFWVPLREIRLKADLLTILARLRARAAKLGGLNDPAVTYACRHLWNLEQNTGRFSWPGVFYTTWKMESGEVDPVKEEDGPPRACTPQLQALVDEAEKAARTRLFSYLWWETLSGLVLQMLLLALPRSEARRGARQTVAHSVGLFGRTDARVSS